MALASALPAYSHSHAIPPVRMTKCNWNATLTTGSPSMEKVEGKATD